MLIQLSMLIITKVQKLPVQEYMIYYILAGLIGLLPALLLALGASAGGISLRALRRHQLPDAYRPADL